MASLFVNYLAKSVVAMQVIITQFNAPLQGSFFELVLFQIKTFFYFQNKFKRGPEKNSFKTKTLQWDM